MFTAKHMERKRTDMKKMTAALLALLLLLSLAACGRPITNDGQPETGEKGKENTQIANPWRDVGEEEARALCPVSFTVPQGAENASWSVMESSDGAAPLVQLVFDLDGLRLTVRAQRTGDRNADISGLYYDWTQQMDSTLRESVPCRLYRCAGEEETVDLCAWYDEAGGAACCVSTAAKDLDGFDLGAIAEALLGPALPSLEEQRRVLEENRALWSFDMGEYSPVWFYTFTDLDHNGLLEVLSASTQGSGLFTAARFYEVLPDLSGVKDLYPESEETEGMDDWPEIILETLPCYYDRAADRYYYVAENDTRDGYAHGVAALAALCLKDGAAKWEYFAVMDVQQTEDGEQRSYTDAQGRPISEEEFNSAADRRFAGMERSELKLDWIEGHS